MRKRLLLALSFVVLIAGYLLFWRYLQVIEDPVEVEATTVKRDNLVSSVIAQGKINSKRIEVMKAPIEGIIQKGRQLKEGDEVRRGDIIVILKRPDEELNALDQDLELAEIDLELVQEQKAQAQELLAAKAISRKQLRELEIREYKQQLAVAHLKDKMKEKVIIAPFSGIIMKKDFKTGQKVEAGAKLLTLVDMNSLLATLWVNEYDISKVQVGQEVVFTGDTFSEDLNGKITTISQMADESTHRGMNTFTVISSIDDYEAGNLLIGSTVEAEICIDENKDVISVPLESVLYRTDEQIVFTVNDDVAHMRRVTTGISNQKMVEITDGLVPGEMVVTRGNMDLREGSKVKVHTK